MEERRRNYAPLVAAIVLALMSGALWALVTWALGANAWAVYGLVGGAGSFVALAAVMSTVT